MNPIDDNVVSLDAMGGDHGVPVNVEGAVQAANEFKIKVALVGNQEMISRELSKYNYLNGNITIIPANEFITMDDLPAAAVRQKKDSSLVVATRLVSEKKASALVSAGNSGAIMASSLMFMGRLPFTLRPAITSVFPTLKGVCIIVDAGANVDCKPKHLLQFAIMGNIYAKEIFGVNEPRIGLLSIGEEKNKGNELSTRTFKLLEKTDLNFIGNIEGRDIPNGKADVAVCDGFVGNIILKFGEGIAEMLFKLIKQDLKKHPLAFAAIPFMWGALKDLRKQVDYSEYGGAPLLGVNGVSIICHGGSNAKAIKNAVRVAHDFAQKDINKKISEDMEKFEWIENNE